MTDTPKVIHSSNVTMGDDGWIIPRCTCGWLTPAVPSYEEVMDLLMDHAAEAAFGVGYRRGRLDEREGII
jgi:hypothetical protein